MCGRFVVARANAELLPLFGIDAVADELPGMGDDIRPSQQIATVIQSEGADSESSSVRRLESARWGFVPRIATSLKSGPTPFNARSEKLTTSPMYRPAFARQRAIIPATGFYEWRKSDHRKFLIRPEDSSWLAFAGIYEWYSTTLTGGPESYVPESGGRAGTATSGQHLVLSTTIITGPPLAAMREIHDREPLYLAPEVWDAWLDPDTQGNSDLLDFAFAAKAKVADSLVFEVS
jgi:putative SOS response-associated peptidase YedK